MAFTILLALEAEQDLAAIRDFLVSNDSPETAREVLFSIRGDLRSLGDLPARGHLPPELLATGGHVVREIHSGPYRLIYEVRGQTVYVHAVLDARRDLRDLLLARLIR